jgi:ACS family tartrate transporter-like MFS transporter
MKVDVGFSDAVYGFGAGIFFIGYFLFEVPSNLILQRVGARVWISRIMITWGLVACAMIWIRSAAAFYVLRFLLGVSEAGFFPGILFYLTCWFPADQTARAIALFMTATAMAGVVGGPVSGLLLGLNAAGLAGWQWLFLIEGFPAVVLGAAVLFYLPDHPRQARWLAPEERDWLIRRLDAERREREPVSKQKLVEAFASPRVWIFCIIYFMLVLAFYGVGLWLPQLLKAAAPLSDLQVGLLSAIPYIVASVGMVLIGRHSDYRRERRWHTALPMIFAAVGLGLCSRAATLGEAVLLLCLITLGIWGALGPFWALPTGFLSGTAAAAGIALINSVGNLGGFAGPYLVGILKNRTASFAPGLLALAASLFFSACLVIVSGEGRSHKRQRTAALP